MSSSKTLLPVVFLCAFCAAPGLPQSHELSLNEAVEYALDHSRELKISDYDVLKATYGLIETKGKKLPTVSFQGSGSWMTNPQEGFSIDKGAFGYSPTPNSEVPIALPDQDYILLEDSEPTYFSFSTSLTQPIITWGRLNAAIQAAEQDVRISETTALDLAYRIKKDVGAVYYSVMLSEKTAALLKQAEDTSAEIVKDRERSMEEGLIVKQDILAAESVRASLAAQRVVAEEGYRTALASLQLLTGLAAGDVSLSSSFRNYLPDLHQSFLTASAIESSTDRKILYLRLKQTEALKSLERGGGMFRPNLSLNVKLDITGQKIPFFSASWQDSWDINLIISIGTSVNLFDAGIARARINKAEQDRLSAEEGLQGLDENISFAVRQGLERIRVAWYETRRTDALRALAFEQKRNAEISFENEIITREETLNARIAALISEIEHQIALYTYELSLLELEYLTGETID